MEDIDLLTRVIEYNKNRYNAFKNGIVLEPNVEYERILSARYMKVSRIKKRLFYLIFRYKYIWFCTFTFDDYYINKCNRTQKDLIKSCINKFDFKYILNVDYGKQTERKHYHCIVATDYNFNLDTYFKNHYPCFSSALLCNTNVDDLKRLTKYINKLTNHCIKSTCNKERILYNFKGFDNYAPDLHSSNLVYKLTYDNFLNVTRT